MVIARNIQNEKLIRFLRNVISDDPTVSEKHLHYFITGSRQYQVETPESDYNIVINPPYWEREFEGIKLDYTKEDGYDWLDIDTNNYRVTIPGRDIIFNIIVPIDEHEYLRWKFATTCMTQLCNTNKEFARLIKEKDARLDIFDAFLTIYY